MAGVEVFHVSCGPYAVGETIRPFGETRYVGRLRADTHFRIAEDAIEAALPPGLQSRLTAVFAFPELEDCLGYWTGQAAPGRPYNGLTPHYYRGLMPNPARVPSRLVSHVSRLIQEKRPHAGAVAEFWSPTKAWRGWEYMDQEFHVLAILDEPEDEGVYLANMMADILLAKSLWSLPELAKLEE